MLERFRLAKFNDIPLPRIGLRRVPDAQLNDILAQDCVGRWLQGVAQTEPTKTNNLPGALCPCLADGQHLYIADHLLLNLAVPDDVHCVRVVVLIVNCKLECDEDVPHVSRLRRHFRQGKIALSDLVLQGRPLGCRIGQAFGVSGGKDLVCAQFE